MTQIVWSLESHPVLCQEVYEVFLPRLLQDCEVAPINHLQPQGFRLGHQKPAAHAFVSFSQTRSALLQSFKPTTTVWLSLDSTH